MATLYWLCRLDWSARPLHWASAAVTITDALGVIRDHAGGLSVSYDASMELFSDGTSIPSVTLGALMPPPDVDVAALIEAGHVLDGAPMELALWWDDDDYEDRTVMVIGRARLPAYGAPGEPLEFGLEPAGVVDDGRIIGPQEAVTAETWPHAREDDIGRTYPRVYGRPGMGREITRPVGMNTSPTFDCAVAQETSTTGGNQHLADLLDFYDITLTYSKGAAFLLIAGHPIDATVVRVYAAYPDAVGAASLGIADAAVVAVPDRLGHVCSLVDLTIYSADAINYAIDYAHSSTNGGGVRSTTRTGEAMGGAGEILMDLLTFSSVPVDRQAFAGVRDLLDRYRLDFYIDDPAVSPLEFIQSNLLPILPLSLVLGPRGLYPVIWLPDDQPSVMALTAGVGLWRAGLVEYEGEVWNEVTLAFAPNLKGDLMRRATFTGLDLATAVVTPTVDIGEHVTISSAFARASVVRHGRRAKSIESIVVYDEATAGAVVAWQARAHAQPWRSIRYAVDPEIVARRAGTRGSPGLRLGDYVTLTDSELSIDRRAIVRSVAWTDLDPEVELLLIDDDGGT